MEEMDVMAVMIDGLTLSERASDDPGMRRRLDGRFGAWERQLERVSAFRLFFSALLCAYSAKAERPVVHVVARGKTEEV